jgi:N,N'-diacetyllegionaminate synthase
MVKIIAEIGSVHDGSIGNALCLINAAAESGADAVKFQTHIAEAETVRDAPAPPFFPDEPRFDYFKRTAFTFEQWKQIKNRCDERDILFLSSPFSEKAVDLLEELGIAEYKIPSGEVTNLPLLKKIARLHKPILLSSGMSSWDELDAAVALIRNNHNQLTVLQCTSEYPCSYEHVGLNIMLEMVQRYRLPVGLSDHTLTPFASYAAVTLGACVIEKHFTLSRRMHGSDARHSLEPHEFADMARGIRAIETMTNSKVDKNDLADVGHMKGIFEKSIVARRTLARGTVLTEEDLDFKKPGTGISAARWEALVGRRLKRDKPADEMIMAEDLE